MQEGKMTAEKALQIAEERREVKGKREKKIYSHMNAESKEQQVEMRKPS